MRHLERACYGNNNIWFYILIIVLTFAFQTFLTLALSAIYVLVNGDILFFSFDVLVQKVDSNLVLLLLMVPMAGSLFFMLLLIKLIHGRSFAEVVNGSKEVRWKRVGVGFGVWFGLLVIVTGAQLLIDPDQLLFQFDLASFIPLFFISVLLIPLQTTFEEVLVRGYLAQGVGSRTRSRWLALIIPALIFTSLHFANPEIREHGFFVMTLTYLSMSLIWGVISILDDGIELTIGMHAANNLFISLFTSQKGAAFETHAVFEVLSSNPWVDLAVLLISGGLVVAFFYRKYNWSWKTLNIRVEKREEASVEVH